MRKKYNVAIVGATGLVGSTFLKIMSENKFPVNNLKLYASSKSEGRIISYENKNYYVEDLEKATFDNIDFTFFSAGASISKKYAPLASSKGSYVIDNSSAFRMDNDIALIIPEINLNDYVSKSKIIANPNCSTIQSALPLKVIKEHFGLVKVNYATYQSVSGSGQKGINDLNKTREGKKPDFYPYNITKTCIPQIDDFLDNGYTKEEMKMVNETRKILHSPDLKVSATCIRVPVENAHGVLIQAQLTQPFELNEIRNYFRKEPGIVLIDEPMSGKYPVSTIATGNDMIYVGRLRKDLTDDQSIIFYTVSDNIRKGAATNAIQIALAIINKEE